MTRSHAPIFWILFGAGGMLAALAGPALVYVTGIDPWVSWVGGMSYAQVANATRSILVKLFLFAVVMLFAWHAAHRILCSLHDVGIRKGLLAKVCCYGVAAVLTGAAGSALLALQ